MTVCRVCYLDKDNGFHSSDGFFCVDCDAEEKRSPEQWDYLDGTIILVGALLFQASLFKSGYPVEIVVELQERVNKIVKRYGGNQ